MIEAKASTSEQHIVCELGVEGHPNELGAEMHAIIMAFVRNLLQNSIPGKELVLTMFLEKRFAQAVHEAYQEYMQGEKHEHTD